MILCPPGACRKFERTRTEFSGTADRSEMASARYGSSPRENLMSLASITINEQIRIPAEVVDLASFREWARSEDFPENGRISYLAGELEIDMSPENINAHSTLKGCLTVALTLLAEADESGQVFPDGTLVINRDADLATEPDVIFVSFDSLQSGRVRLGELPGQEASACELIGAPDLVIEIVSPSSVRKDKQILRERYFVAGVREYWLIDARQQVLSFEILVPGADAFASAKPDSEGFLPSPLWNRRFRLIRQDHPTGLVRYRLESAT